MAAEEHYPRRLLTVTALAIAGLMTVAGVLFAVVPPAAAQFFERRQRQAPSQESFNPFGFLRPLFQRDPREQWERREPRRLRERPLRPRESRAAPADQTKPPPAQKNDTTPTKHVAVMGASLSDWLAYGLEDIYSDRPEIGIVRKNHLLTGLVRFDTKNDVTWPRVARDFLKDQNPDVIVVLLGLEDRVTLRERASARDAQQPGESGQPSNAEPEQRRQGAQSFEFRTEQWAEAYAKRVDEMIAVLKSKGVPVIWVGLPAIRGTRSTGDMIYLNDVFRARAERAGIIYVDVWDGFVDESGRFTTFGPDVEGQVRRLRTSEGVFFTEAGARKLAHYVEREIKHVMGTRLQPMALPTDESGQPAAPRPGQPAARPEAGPVVSLTNAGGANELLGGTTRTGAADPLAVRVLVHGAAVSPQSGRADNFFLTPEAAEAAKAAAAASGVDAARAAESAAPPAAVSAAAPAVEPTFAEEPKAGGQDETDRPAKKPVASVDLAPAAAPRGATPSRPAARAADRRTRRPSRSTAQKLRPTTPRTGQAAERRAPSRPVFDPLGLFR